MRLLPLLSFKLTLIAFSYHLSLFAMEETKRTKAIILNRSDYRESDSLLLAYTENYGKLSLLARGTKKLLSKMAGHLEPGTLVDLMIVKGRGFDYAGSVQTLDGYLPLREDFNKAYYSGCALRRFNRLVREGEKDENLFRWLQSWLEALASAPVPLAREDGELLFDFFALKLLTELGYRPELYDCLGCRQAIIPGKNYFDLKDGGLLCPDCLAKRPPALAPASQLRLVSDDVVKLLRFLVANDLGRAKKLRLEKKARRELGELLAAFLDFQE